MRRRLAALFERGRRARLADRPGRRAAARGAAGRASLRHANRRPGQRARRRPRQPDRHPGDQRPGRPRLRRACRSPCSYRRAWGRDELLLDAAEALERANGRRWVEALAAAGPGASRRRPEVPAIVVEGLRAGLRRGARGAGSRPRGRRGRDLRLPRPQRRRQDDDGADADHAAAADRRPGHRRRPRRRRARRAPCGPRSASPCRRRRSTR